MVLLGGRAVETLVIEEVSSAPTTTSPRSPTSPFDVRALGMDADKA
jgi:hypothetical protein